MLDYIGERSLAFQFLIRLVIGGLLCYGRNRTGYRRLRQLEGDVFEYRTYISYQVLEEWQNDDATVISAVQVQASVLVIGIANSRTGCYL